MTPRITSEVLTRRRFLRLLLASGGAVSLSPLLRACRGTPGPVETTAAPASGILNDLEGIDINTFFEVSYRRWLMRDPEVLTALGLANACGVGNADLTDISDAFIRETQSIESGVLGLLRGYDRTALSPAQALTADVYDWFLDDLVRSHPFMYHTYPVSPAITSIPYTLYLLFTVWHPLNNRKDADDYVTRLSQIGTKLGQLIDGLRRRQEHGVVLPAFMIPIVRADLNSVAYGEPPTHAFYESFAERLTGVSGDERQTLLEQVAGQIEEVVHPAYQELSSYLNESQVIAPREVGVWQLPDGDAYYSQALRHQAFTEMAADEIHQTGLRHVERIHAEMRPLFAELGYASDRAIPDLISQLTNDCGFYEGESAVDAYEEAIHGAESLLPQAFDISPGAELMVVGGPEGDYYDPPPYDGSRPGIFYASTSGITPRFGVKTLAYHEAIPGHHLQASIAQGNADIPTLRRGMQFNAYCEGWALYAERLMWELGAYEDDPPGNLGRLQAEAYRAARLTVDTGIHAKRWDFNQAVDYLVEATGFPTAIAQSEVMRYSVWPGQAVSYYLGFLQILEMRRRAMQSLAAGYDLKTFHRVILANASLPLPILDTLVDSYIATHS